jgi:hypothetical protein
MSKLSFYINCSYDYRNPVVRLIHKEIGALEHVILHIENDYIQNNKKFVGKAFVSFKNELMKEEVLK